MRHQLKGTSIRVFEVIPPTVYDTELKGKPIEKADWTVSAAQVAEEVVKGMQNNEYEIAIGPSKGWITSSKNDLDEAFKSINH